ncbi:RNA 2',3'-cyclic phosphodiesterase [Candidatus Pelagadaptatus aseana]|uniref:RNA 2',3'-cyclic phosphodiesterase n=1 Tax=Candidatus Pelagadaptatus aseana TaxID=3120508 RepID=UPI003C6ED5AD
MKPQVYRSFIGIPVCGKVHQALDQWLNLRQQLCQKHDIPPPIKERQIPAENRHLTLHFLGDLTHQQRQTLHLNLQQHVTTQQAFDLELNQLCHFPDAKSPILAATCETTPELKKLYSATTYAIQKAGLSRLMGSKAYRPHITLIRAKGKALPDENTLLETMEKSGICMPCNKVVLYQSTVTSTGSIYNEIKHYCLKSRL